MLELLQLLLTAGIIALVVVNWYKGRKLREHAHAAGYFAGVSDCSIAVSQDKSLATADRPWADQDWYLKHCAGEVQQLEDRLEE